MPPTTAALLSSLASPPTLIRRHHAQADAARLASFVAAHPLRHDVLLDLTSTIRDADLAQDALVALLEGEPETETEAQNIVARARYRHQWADRTHRQRSAPLADAETSADAPYAPTTGPIYDAATTLPAHLRDALLAHVCCGLTITETAEALHVTRQTASRWIAAAKEQIRVTFLPSPTPKK